MRHFISIAAALALAGCIPAQAVVSDFNGASVKIQTNQLASAEENRAAAQLEADRICAKEKRRAEYASTRTLPDYVQEHLFLCLG